MVRPSPNPQAETAANVNDKAEGSASNDDMLSYIKTSITSLIVSARGNVSKFKPGNFHWTSLVVILASQGLVMQGWPASVSMPGERGSSKSKGITVLKQGEQRALCSAFENGEITLVQIQEKAERRAFVNSESLVIIGAPPPADSNLACAQQIYADSTINFEGPARLPHSKAATRIKHKPSRTPLATADDPIILSSGDDANTPPRVLDKSDDVPPPARLTKDIRPVVITKKPGSSKALKKPVKYIVLDGSSDDEARPHPDRSVTVASEEDYQDPGPSHKCKANNLATTHPAKKLTLIPHEYHVKLTKDKERAADRKVSSTAALMDPLDSDEDTSSEITVKASSKPSAGESDLFLAPSGTQKAPSPVTPTSQMLQGVLDALVPSSPSPKRHAHLQSLTESDEFPPTGTVPPPFSPVSVGQSDQTTMPACPALRTAEPPHPPHAPTVGYANSTESSATQPPMAPSGTVPPQAALPAPPGPSAPPMPPVYHAYVGGEQGEWLDQSCQQIGGGYPYQQQRPYFPYQVDSGMIPPHRYHDVPLGMYPNPIYRDPRGMYGGFHPASRDPAHGGPHYANHMEGLYQDHLHFGTAPPGPSHTHRSPSLADPHHASIEPKM